MKKKILSIAFVAAIAVAGAWNFMQSQDEVTLSDLALENVEALAECEPTTGGSCWYSNNLGTCCEAGDSGCSPCGS
jgi:hypothetical protein